MWKILTRMITINYNYRQCQYYSLINTQTVNARIMITLITKSWCVFYLESYNAVVWFTCNICERFIRVLFCPESFANMYVKLNTTVSCLGPFKLYRWLHFQTSKIEKKTCIIILLIQILLIILIMIITYDDAEYDDEDDDNNTLMMIIARSYLMFPSQHSDH